MKPELMFEIVPPSKRSSEKQLDNLLNKLTDSINNMNTVKILNIPEIVEENFCGRPYFKNMDNRIFGHMLRENTKKQLLINKVVVHFDSRLKFNQWINKTVYGHKINHYIFVGGTFMRNYPGPSVLEANQMGLQHNISIGNIMIPNRKNEASNMFKKTQAGCTFFTTQILFESYNTIKVLNEYAELCKIQNQKPAKIYLSFSPISDNHDIEFLRWLGAHIDKETEKLIKNSNFGKCSLDIVSKIYCELRSNLKNILNLNINIEHITLRNLGLSEQMVDIFS